jgi:hypothetical protein
LLLLAFFRFASDHSLTSFAILRWKSRTGEVEFSRDLELRAIHFSSFSFPTSLDLDSKQQNNLGALCR